MTFKERRLRAAQAASAAAAARRAAAEAREAQEIAKLPELEQLHMLSLRRCDALVHCQWVVLYFRPHSRSPSNDASCPHSLRLPPILFF